MREVRGTYMEVTALDFYKDMNTDDYFHITLTDEEDIGCDREATMHLSEYHEAVL